MHSCILFFCIIKNMKNIAVLLMGGDGTRFNQNKPKQFYLYHNKPLFIYCLQTFAKFNNFIEICLVINTKYTSLIKKYLNLYKLENKITLIEKGLTRAESLFNAICYIKKQYDEPIKIISHDIARTFVSKSIIQEHINLKLNPQTVINTILPLSDSIIKINKNKINTLDRNKYFLIQTPQSFNSKELYELIHKHYQKYLTYNDLCSFAIAKKYECNNVLGNSLNFKITNKSDIDLLNLNKINSY